MLFADQTDAAQVLLVGMADFAAIQNQNAILYTHPLGACLGVGIFDATAKVAGVLHSLLPDSTIDAARAERQPGMFLDSGLSALLKRARELGARDERLTVCVAGGARILDETSLFNIGHRNMEVLTKLLSDLSLKIEAQDTGGLSNRAMRLNAATGEVRLKISGEGRLKTLCKPLTTT